MFCPICGERLILKEEDNIVVSENLIIGRIKYWQCSSCLWIILYTEENE